MLRRGLSGSTKRFGYINRRAVTRSRYRFGATAHVNREAHHIIVAAEVFRNDVTTVQLSERTTQGLFCKPDNWLFRLRVQPLCWGVLILKDRRDFAMEAVFHLEGDGPWSWSP